MHAVLDTNVLVSALRSSKGASAEILRLIHEAHIRIALSVPLVVEYESVLLRPDLVPTLSAIQIGSVINGLCSLAWHQEIYFLWRPHLPDPKDDMVLELALAARMSYIITHNKNDFAPAASVGVKAITPAEALQILSKQ